MNSLVSKARWLGTLLTAGALLLGAAGPAAAGGHHGGPVRGVPRTVALDASPAAVAVSPDGRRAYVAVKDSIHGLKLKTVDTRTGAITAVVTLTTGFGGDAGPMAVSPDGSRVYVLLGPNRHFPASVLGVVDTATDTLVSSTEVPDQPRPSGTYPGGLSALAVSPDGSQVYVTQDGPASWHRPPRPGARVLSFSAKRQAFTDALSIPGRYPASIVVRPDGDDAYVATETGLVHLALDDEPPAVVGTVAATAGTIVNLALDPDDTHVHGVGDDGKGYTVDLDTDTVDATFDIAPGQRLQNPAVSRDGSRLYAVGQDTTSPDGKASVLSLDLATHHLVPTEGVPGLQYVTGLAVGPDGHTFYVTVNDTLRIIGF
ncbi:YncE family protein [Kitasatospora sp. NPDC096077]|uniref:YncE family protein n=1 Tax=Kitasatospora sp. NPDC096077 TaxID=3155544 RepID=UPI00331B03FB